MRSNDEPGIPVTRDTAEFLLNVVNMLSLSANDPEFEDTAKKIVAAKIELSEIVVEGMAEKIAEEGHDD